MVCLPVRSIIHSLKLVNDLSFVVNDVCVYAYQSI